MLVDANLVPTIKDELKDMMVEAGFTNITVVYKYHSLSGHTNEGKMQW
jgi:hypothetical protein